MKKVLLSVFALAAVVAIPAAVGAATFAFVNTTGEVRTVEATTASQALMTAPGIGMHSGVMLIEDSSDQDVVGDKVNGV